MKILTLQDVLEHEIQDLYSAEKQIITAVPKMAKVCTSGALRQALEDHVDQTKNQVSRLEEAANLLKLKVTGEKCKGMEGLLREGAALLEAKPSYALDAAIIAASQRVEHYEMAGYGSAIELASELGRNDVAEILEATFSEEEEASNKLSLIGETEVNTQADTK